MLRLTRTLFAFKHKTFKREFLLTRNFLSQAYYCNEIWEQRLNNPLLQKINLDDFYNDIEQKYQKTNKINSIDVDLFVNTVNDDTYFDEMLDVVHKLRLSEDASNMLDSTSHAVIRIFTKYEKHDELMNVLNDRLNYGIFLDLYTANLLLNTYWKNGDYLNGVRTASQLMLQEDFGHPLSVALSSLHCYKYLQDPKDWPEPAKPEEPEEEVKVRVKFLRNPFDDDHFDLKDKFKIVGKTLVHLNKNSSDNLSKTFYIVGLKLFGKDDKVAELINTVKEPLCKEVLDLLPEDKRIDLPTYTEDVEKLLKEKVIMAEKQTSEKDIAKQCEVFHKWEIDRKTALDIQIEKLRCEKRLSDIAELQKQLKLKEEKLWFFDNEEQIELDIEAKKIYYPKRWFGKKKKPRKIDVDYIPPEVNSQKL